MHTHAHLTADQTAISEEAEVEVAEIVRGLVARYGSDAKLAKATGFATVTVAMWRRGDRRPPTGTLAALLDACGLRLRLVVESKSPDPDDDELRALLGTPHPEVIQALRQAREVVARLERAVP